MQSNVVSCSLVHMVAPDAKKQFPGDSRCRVITQFACDHLKLSLQGFPLKGVSVALQGLA